MTLNEPEQLPNPGSDEAVRLGCECPRMDNGNGRGYLGNPNVFVYSLECPLHKKQIPPIASASVFTIP